MEKIEKNLSEIFRETKCFSMKQSKSAAIQFPTGFAKHWLMQIIISFICGKCLFNKIIV